MHSFSKIKIHNFTLGQPLLVGVDSVYIGAKKSGDDWKWQVRKITMSMS